MRPIFVTIQVVSMCFLLGLDAQAAKKQTSSTTKSLPSTKLSTDIHFDDLMVKGRRQSPLGITSAVEADKTTPSLIDYRSDYRDRLSQMEEGR